MKMPPEKRRACEADIAAVLKATGHMTEIQALNKLEFMERLHREVTKPSGGRLYLSAPANTSFSRLVDAIGKYLPSKDLVKDIEVFRACKAVVGKLCEEGCRKLDVESFISAVEEVIAATIQTHRFYTTLDGLEFVDFAEFRIGRLVIQKPDFAILQGSEAHTETRDNLWKRVDGALWITEDISGSREHCERRFFESVSSVCGLLSLSFTMDAERGASGIRLSPCMDTRARPHTSSWFSFTADSKVLCVSSSWKSVLVSSLREIVATDLLDRDWFQNLTRITQGNGQSEVEQAVRRGIYWFFDAQLDTSLEMQMVKFWSCIECIFSFLGVHTTKSIRDGMTGMLILGGYKLVDMKDKMQLRKDIKRLYDLRCGAVHDAKHNHVTERDVAMVSKWAAWVMIEVAGLAEAGVQTRAEIKIQTDYWFELLQEKGSTAKAREKCPTCGGVMQDNS
ncbi:HEPN domain-containing protein [Pseudomonas coronafaciens]|uniref:Uncharacterized protein n=1 Tax=Pseudomonas coronafaciens pv. striafaciens TaxID=235276 RepID=A0A3M4XWN4_9PSED|nr:HEPN domain-containing protein [Pseudomonas coronafaciens]KPZ26563.1 Uncharacterized protein ALO38_00130 [Pseudomonas coronafaciens pv. zizaniae]RMR80908.1 hypothetical protein ALP78_02272 [Pseudomonas coronafaciens pv. striafaciens]